MAGWLLTAGVLCGLWEVVFGQRKWQAGETALRERARFAWKERRVGIIGAGLVVASAVIEGASGC